MFQRRKKLILFVVLSMALLVVGCSSVNDVNEQDPAYGLKVAINIPDALLAEVNALTTIEDEITVEEIKVSIYQEDGSELIDTETLDNPLDDNKIVFDSLESGKQYKVKAELIGDFDGLESSRVLYEGSAISPEIESDTVSDLDIDIEPLLAQSLQVNEVDIRNEEGEVVDIEVEKLRLELDPDNRITKDYQSGLIFENGDGLDDSGDLELTPSQWEVKVKLASDEQWHGAEFLLLPTQEREIGLDVEVDESDKVKEGGIEVAINVPSSPDAPTSLSIEDGELTWDGEGEFYKVYQTESDNQADLEISVATVTDKSYSDLEAGHYYWVRAFDENNYSSSLSDSVKAKAVNLLEVEVAEQGTSANYLDLDDITLDYDLEVAKYQVTNAEYLEFLNSVGVAEDGSYKGEEMMDVNGVSFQFAYYNDQFHLKYWTDINGDRIDIRNYPVVYVTWYGAVAYTNWLSEEAGLEPAYDLDSWKLKDDKENLEGYRLPSVDEWEYAARGGSNGDETEYSGSDDLDDVAWHGDNSDVSGSSNLQTTSGRGTHPVGLKAPNELGIYDMSGNVREWTNTERSDTSMATRGGAFNDTNLDRLRVSWSFGVTTESGFFNSSFRPVRTK